jgi:hypothetical protein
MPKMYHNPSNHAIYSVCDVRHNYYNYGIEIGNREEYSENLVFVKFLTKN